MLMLGEAPRERDLIFPVKVSFIFSLPIVTIVLSSLTIALILMPFSSSFKVPVFPSIEINVLFVTVYESVLSAVWITTKFPDCR